MPRYPAAMRGFGAMLKPHYPQYFYLVRNWLRKALQSGRHFDIAHQIMPQAPRYPIPMQGMGVPYVIGPVGGALKVPQAFQREAMKRAAWYTRLRGLDEFRFRHDPWLRKSYRDAELVLGVAPYVRDVLRQIPLKRFETFLELGVDDLAPLERRRYRSGFRLLHVGRGVRTKGLIDVVRAMAKLNDLPGIHLTSAGEGPEIASCKMEAELLGISGHVTFEGSVPRERVEQLYQMADVFVFPSFREAAGNVLYEAMRNGLPVVSVASGGPDSIVDHNSGIKLDLSTPNALVTDIASAVRRLYLDPDLRERLGQGARDKIGREGLWQAKAEDLADRYARVLERSQTTPQNVQ
jgi:glycosyltransferase involved in cell wall biosynthesis